MTSMKDVYWLAGWLEGEGCFNLHPSRHCYRYPRISGCSTDKDIMVRVGKLLRVKVYEEPEVQPVGVKGQKKREEAILDAHERAC